ncbi:MAG: MFS transporter, partial [Clostridia bacterium]|nr:MFS transporter [Clostridia bacterium]
MRKAPFRASMLTALALFAASQALLLITPAGAIAVPLLVVGAVLEAVALSILSPLTSSLLFINADPEERARVCGLVYATISLIVAVFPGLIGRLANLSIRIPFFISIGLFAFTAVLTVIISRLPAPDRD